MDAQGHRSPPEKILDHFGRDESICILEYLHEIFSVMAHDWGYDYFKIDATAFGAYAGRRFDPSRPAFKRCAR